MLTLRDNLRLEIMPGATLKASGDAGDYPIMGRRAANVSKVDMDERHFLYAKAVRNLWIGGGGTIDGSGPAFWNPPTDCAFFTAKPDRVTRMIELFRCEDVVFRDLRIIDSPSWTVHVHGCKNLRLNGIDIRNNLLGPNTDGIDITDSSDIFVSDSTIIAGDDSIVLKSDGGVNERIHVTNCMCHTNCSALKLGANESLGTIRQVVMSNCVVRNSSRGISLYCMGGGTFEDISFSNIILECDNDMALVCPIHIHASRNPDPKRAHGVGRIRNVTIGDVTCKSDARILMACEAGGALEQIRLHDIHMEYPKVEDEFERARKAEGKLQFSPFTPEARAAKSCVVAYNVTGLELTGISTGWPREPGVRMHFLWARGVADGFVDCPRARASDAATPAYDIGDSEIVIRSAGGDAATA